MRCYLFKHQSQWLHVWKWKEEIVTGTKLGVVSAVVVSETSVV